MSPFSHIEKASIPRSAFDLSYEKKMTADMGLIYPVLHDEAVPGDIWDISNSAVLRFQPLVAPVLQEIKVRTYYFFVPYRLLDSDWEEFITRGVTGNSVKVLPITDPAVTSVPATSVAVGSLWDYLGYPTTVEPPPEACPIDYPRRAYIRIWNEYFRDETLQTELDETDQDNNIILRCNWLKDYFTSASITQQRGLEPALPIFGSGTTDFTLPFTDLTGLAQASQMVPIQSTLNANDFGSSTTGGTPIATGGQQAIYSGVLSDNNALDLSSLSSVDIADLRLAFQLQAWMERNSRAGARYTEFLQAQYNVSPTDERLQRAEFLGGTSNDVIISEVLQTGETGSSPQGNLAGHGISVSGNHIDKYRVEEFGIMLGVLVVTPKAAYQDGINRQWLRRTTFEFYNPLFADLSEQEIKNAELTTLGIVADPVGTQNNAVFGYTGIFNEMRYKPSLVCGQMRTTFDYWHLGRQFNPASAPALNSAFIECNPRKDIFAVPSEPTMVISFGNHLNVLRPMPIMAIPGSIIK